MPVISINSSDRIVKELLREEGSPSGRTWLPGGGALRLACVEGLAPVHPAASPVLAGLV